LAPGPVEPHTVHGPYARIGQQGGEVVGEAKRLHDPNEGIEGYGPAAREPGQRAARDSGFPCEVRLGDVPAEPDFVEALAQCVDDGFAGCDVEVDLVRHL